MNKTKFKRLVCDLYMRAYGRPTASNTYEINVDDLDGLFELIQFIDDNIDEHTECFKPEGTI